MHCCTIPESLHHFKKTPKEPVGILFLSRRLIHGYDLELAKSYLGCSAGKVYIKENLIIQTDYEAVTKRHDFSREE